MRKLCLQFYTVGQEMDPFTKVMAYYLQSGFHGISETIPKIWVDENPPLSLIIKQQIEEAQQIYVSVWSWFHLLRVVKWANVFSDKIFTIGGPIPRFFMSPAEICKFVKIPGNVILYGGMAEDLLESSSKWSIVVPQTLVRNNYSYTIGEVCYWKKCNFCRYKEGGGRTKYTIEDLYDAPAGGVWLDTPALTPKQLELLPLLNFDDKFYQGFIRGDFVIYPKLKEILPKIPKPERIGFRIGVEFPSNRMLKNMNKGTTVEDLLRVINLLSDHGIRMMLLYIYDWPELELSDVIEAKNFLKTIGNRAGDNIIHTVSRLLMRSDEPLPLHPGDSKLMEEYSTRYSYFPTLSEECRKTNEEWLAVLMDQPGFVKHRRFTKQRHLPTG